MTTDDNDSETEDAKVESEERAKDGIEGYPIDSLLIRTETRTIQDVLRRMERGFFLLDPDFQREFLWNSVRQSRLIESVLMRIPLPVFYLAEKAEDGKLVVVDGRQRLSSFFNFFKGVLALRLAGSPLDGQSFKDLEPKLQNRFEDGQLTFYIVDAKVPERVSLDIFERVNSGEPLTRQQMRNALHNGPATKLLSELATSLEFRRATLSALSTDEHRKAMDDREAVNRWLSFKLLGWQSYGPHTSYEEFLGEGLKRVNRKPDSVTELKAEFRQSMRVNERVFGRHAFRKHLSPFDRRRPLNLALFDVFAVLLGPIPEAAVAGREHLVQAGFQRLMADGAFEDAISRGTLSNRAVSRRFEKVGEMLQGVIHVSSSSS